MRTREHGRAVLRDRIRDLQRMDDSVAELVDTCGLPLPTGGAHCSTPSTTGSTATVRR